jgi:cobalamin synthase
VRNRTDREATDTRYCALERGVARSFPAPDSKKEQYAMNLNLSIGPLVSLVAGILILLVPRLLNYIVAIYLIIIGLLGLFGGGFHLK